jgi:hypothetical protein
VGNRRYAADGFQKLAGDALGGWRQFSAPHDGRVNLPRLPQSDAEVGQAGVQLLGREVF